jgi:hypothetical protein
MELRRLRVYFFSSKYVLFVRNGNRK